MPAKEVRQATHPDPASSTRVDPIAPIETGQTALSDKKKKIETTLPNGKEFDYEFGGPIGTLLIMIWSHWILYYFWYCYEFHHCSMALPSSLSPSDSIAFFQHFGYAIMQRAMPTITTLTLYTLFFVSQLILAAIIPGPTVYGFKVSSMKDKKLPYLCNGWLCYYITLSAFLGLHITGVFPITSIIDDLGAWLTTAVLFGDLTSLYWYIYGFMSDSTLRMSGNHIYDFFMGSLLYPRFGIADIKMISEVRWSWLSLFLITVSCAVKEYQTYGVISANMFFMVIAHWLYSNATVKGEHYIPYFWDIYYEKYGWMLNFWNIAGVPFLYNFQSLYVWRNRSMIVGSFVNSWPYLIVCYLLLFIAYYVWDCSNGQKADFKNPEIRHLTRFPRLPHAYIDNPKYIQSNRGKLLIDGFWKYGRKMNYSGDITMALLWGLICGFNSPLPFFYVTFFVSFLSHRLWRDDIKCAKKYGHYWKQYKQHVPHIFIPYIF